MKHYNDFIRLSWRESYIWPGRLSFNRIALKSNDQGSLRINGREEEVTLLQ